MLLIIIINHYYYIIIIIYYMYLSIYIYIIWVRGTFSSKPECSRVEVSKHVRRVQKGRVFLKALRERFRRSLEKKRRLSPCLCELANHVEIAPIKMQS